MKEIRFLLSDEDYKALEWQVASPEQWILDATMNKVNKSRKRMLLELSDKRLDKITSAESISLIKNSELKTRKQRDEATRTIA